MSAVAVLVQLKPPTSCGRLLCGIPLMRPQSHFVAETFLRPCALRRGGLLHRYATIPEPYRNQPVGGVSQIAESASSILNSAVLDLCSWMLSCAMQVQLFASIWSSITSCELRGPRSDPRMDQLGEPMGPRRAPARRRQWPAGPEGMLDYFSLARFIAVCKWCSRIGSVSLAKSASGLLDFASFSYSAISFL
jgi:hypothetical protein